MADEASIQWIQIVVVTVGYLLTFLTSGLVIRLLIGVPDPKQGEKRPKDDRAAGKYQVGTIIGKCENFRTITFILSGAYTGLALIFAAKSIVRSDDIKRDPRFYLGGTLVNFSYSVMMAFLIRVVLSMLGHPLAI